MKLLSITTADTVQFSRIVRGLNFFGSMNMAMLERILDGIQLYECDRGEKICVQGEPGDTFFVVQKGALTVSVRKGKLSMPVLALGGEKSFAKTMAEIMRFAASNVEEGVIPDCGHWIMEENPSATIAMVRAFLQVA